MKNDIQEQTPSDVLTPTTVSDIVGRLVRIEAKLDGKMSFWLTEEAVIAFGEYIKRNHRRPDNFDYLLTTFKVVFAEKNIAELTSNEVNEFLLSHWRNAAPSTYNKRKVQLSAFFNFCIQELKRQGLPSFHNPCDLVDDLKETPKLRSGFVPVEKMRELLDSFDDPRHWLQVAIQLTAGLRVGEVLKLRPMDVQGRILTLREPKSGKYKELAVVSAKVAVRLENYAKYRDPEQPLFPTSRHAANRLLKRHAKIVGLELTTHDLRRWISTFWECQGDISMMRFVLRHSGVKDSTGGTILTSLAGRYVANLSPEEAMERQDAFMPSELFKDISAR